MAGVHSGTLSRFNCQKCLRTEALRTKYGCTRESGTPALTEIENGVQYQYWNCPLRFVGINVVDFMKRLHYYKQYNVIMPEYGKMPLRFLNASSYYYAKLEEFAELQRQGKNG